MPLQPIRPRIEHQGHNDRALGVGRVGGNTLQVAGEVRRAISQSDRIVKERERAAGVVSDAALFGLQAEDGASRRSAISGVSAIHSLTVNGERHDFARRISPKNLRSAD